MIPKYSQEEFDKAKSFNKLNLQCEFCNCIFSKIKKEIALAKQEHYSGKAKFCSGKCRANAAKKRVKFDCKKCGKESEKLENQYNKAKNHFCSRSCSASYHNSIKPKRKSTKSKRCPGCFDFKSSQSKLCQQCRCNLILEKNLNKEISYFFVNSASRAKYTQIRFLAKKTMAKNKIKKCCKICSFDIVVEVCHIKPISSFSPDALLGEVNSLDNLVYLCPNHHAMLDKGLFSLLD